MEIEFVFTFATVLAAYFGLYYQHRQLKDSRKEVARLSDIVRRLDDSDAAQNKLKNRHERLSVSQKMDFAETLNYSSWVFDNLSEREFMSEISVSDNFHSLVFMSLVLGSGDVDGARKLGVEISRLLSFKTKWAVALKENSKKWQSNLDKQLAKHDGSIEAITKTSELQGRLAEAIDQTNKKFSPEWASMYLEYSELRTSLVKGDDLKKAALLRAVPPSVGDLIDT